MIQIDELKSMEYINNLRYEDNLWLIAIRRLSGDTQQINRSNWKLGITSKY